MQEHRFTRPLSRHLQVDADGKLKWRRVEDNRQLLSPVPVLEVAEFDEISQLHYSNFNFLENVK